MTTRRKALLYFLVVAAVLTMMVAGAVPAAAQQGPQLRVTFTEENDQPDPAVDSNGNVHIAFTGYPCATITYQTFGTSPDRYTVIQWDTFHTTDGDPGLFQAVLWENGVIHVNIEDASSASTQVTGVNHNGTYGVDVGVTPGSNSSFTFTWNGADNYNFSAGEARWVENCCGTPVPACEDDSSGAVPIGFNFTFYGSSYNTVYVSSNGYMSFTVTDPTSPYGPATFPSGDPDAANVIAPLWADWDPEYYRSDEPEISYAMLDGATGAPLIAPTQVSESDDEKSNRPAIGVDSQDNVHIVWHDRASDEVMYTKLDPGLDDQNGGPALDAAITLVPDRAITSLSATDVAANPRIAIDSNDDIHVVWEESSERLKVYYMKVNSIGNELVAPRVIGIPTERGESTRALPQVALDSGDNPHIAFVGYGVDYAADYAAGCTYDTFGTTPNRYTVVQWDTFHITDGDPGTFQAVLHESGLINVNIADSTGAAGEDPVTGVNHNGTYGVDVGEYPPGGGSSYSFTWDGSNNYNSGEIGYNWIDVSGGNVVGAIEDDSSGAVPIGFDFTFYGTSYNTVYVSSNGYMSFTDTDPTESGNPSAFPSGDPDAADVIAPLWADWNPLDEVSYTMLDGATGNFLIAPTIVSDVEDADSKRPSISVDDEDRVHIVWMDKRDGQHEVFYTKLDPALDDRDGSCADEAAITLIDDTALTPDDGVSSYRPTSEIGCGRYIHVTWYEKYDESTYDLHYMVLDKDGSTVVGDTALTTTGTTTTSTSWTNAFLDVDPEDRAHITWCDDRDDDEYEVYYTTYQGPPCEEAVPVGGIVEPVDPLELGAISGEPSNGASNIPAIALGIGMAVLFTTLIVWSVRKRRVISSGEGQ